MDRKKFNKRVIIVIAIIAVVAVLAGTIGTFISSNSSDTKTETKIKKNKYGKVEIKDNLVKSTLTVKDGTKDDDAVKLGDDYANSLQSKYKDKQIEVAVSDKKGFVTNITKNFNPNQSSNAGSSSTSGSTANTSGGESGTSSVLPTASLRIAKGVLDFDRLVVVTLDTPNPEKYKVSILNYQLKYFPDRKIFQQVIQETSEEKMRSNIKVELAQ